MGELRLKAIQWRTAVEPAGGNPDGSVAIRVRVVSRASRLTPATDRGNVGKT